MLPLGLLNAAVDCPLLVELKSGETYNGLLVTCDSWMNIKLRKVICTSSEGDGFLQIPECFIRGCMIKYLRIPDEIFDMVKANNANNTRAIGDSQRTHDSRQGGYHGRGGGGNSNQFSGDRTSDKGQSNFNGGT